ncbi:hypothetical protein GCM10007304_11450 [Rhodococcoides trifolii]|uniref:Uncharacterized protein n=2 Tax=Rhodococcoides trifolii TaxID=908250 RepID=A0A917CUH4_9NOCA|nr:hypothetical protein GCM10007304_11450 [Rhodococcus trifolii]
MRELVKMFADTATLDDIGIGGVRDSLADQLFPATSTVHTRARYFLFIPWIHAAAAAKFTGTAVVSKANDRERVFIETMKAAGHTQGLIGRIAGKGVTILPSSIYWSALGKLGIREDSGPRSAWQVSVEAPAGFPSDVESGFTMTPAEAAWLQERILATSPTSYLAHLVTNGLNVDIRDFESPWDHPALESASGTIRATVRHARLFSLAINGAALLYNLLVAEKYDGVKGSDQAGYVEAYRDLLAEWAERTANHATELRSWDVADFWLSVDRGRSTPIPPGTKVFVDEWIAAVTADEATKAASSSHLRRLVATRERANKGEQSRLNNDRALKNWAGASGAGQLVYRWPNVQTLVGDIAEGLGHAAS